MPVDLVQPIVGSSRGAGLEAHVRFWALPDALQFFAPFVLIESLGVATRGWTLLREPRGVGRVAARKGQVL
jgi:hypothetical protein